MIQNEVLVAGVFTLSLPLVLEGVKKKVLGVRGRQPDVGVAYRGIVPVLPLRIFLSDRISDIPDREILVLKMV